MFFCNLLMTQVCAQPICALDGTSLFFSPCHAGCQTAAQVSILSILVILLLMISLSMVTILLFDTIIDQEPGKRGQSQTVYNSCSCIPSHEASGHRHHSLNNHILGVVTFFNFIAKKAFQARLGGGSTLMMDQAPLWPLQGTPLRPLPSQTYPSLMLLLASVQLTAPQVSELSLEFSW